jgi:hypothetical protein
VAGVGLGHRAPLVGAADLDHHDGNPGLGGLVGGQHQRASVLEAFDVGGDDADVGLGGEVGAEVGELEIGLVAGGRPVREPDADVLALEDRPALVPALGDEGDGLAREVVAEGLEGVEVGVGPEHVDVAVGDERLHAGLQALAFGPDLGEAGGEHHRELRLLLDDLLEGGYGVADQDGGHVDVRGHVEDAAVALHAVDLVAVGVDEEHGRARLLGPAPDLGRHRRIGPAGVVRRADDGDRLRGEERVEVDRPRLHGAPGDVEAHGRRQ